MFKTFLLEVPEYVPNLELSLDISQTDLSSFNIDAKAELKPDVCLYPAARRGLSRPKDILKMSEMPVLEVEILLPKQSIMPIKEKFEVYFFLGVKSCWLVLPDLETITVYSSLSHFKTFDKPGGDKEVIDERLGFKLSLDKIFK